MDFGIIMGVNPSDPSAGSPGLPPYDAFEATRYAMGDTLHYAEKMDLIEMEPRGDLTSTGFALAHPGSEYLVLQPEDGNSPFTVNLETGTYTAEWFNVNSRETTKAENMIVEHNESFRFLSPFVNSGSSVLYLKRVGS
jgi:hypothetical protein